MQATRGLVDSEATQRGLLPRGVMILRCTIYIFCLINRGRPTELLLLIVTSIYRFERLYELGKHEWMDGRLPIERRWFYRLTWFAIKQVVDDMRLLERVEREQIGAERRAVFASLVPRRVERREPIARRPRADLAELRQTR